MLRRGRRGDRFADRTGQRQRDRRCSPARCSTVARCCACRSGRGPRRATHVLGGLGTAVDDAVPTSVVGGATDSAPMPVCGRAPADSRSTSMWAVAPQTVSSSSSKKCSGRSSGGAPQRSTWYTPGRGQLADRRPQHTVDLTRLRSEFGSVVERGDDRHDVAAADDRVQVRQLADHRVQAGSSPTSSCASRSAASTAVSPSSTRPPGKLTSPRWCAHRHRPPGEQHLGASIPFDEREEHRRQP